MSAAAIIISTYAMSPELHSSCGLDQTLRFSVQDFHSDVFLSIARCPACLKTVPRQHAVRCQSSAANTAIPASVYFLTIDKPTRVVIYRKIKYTKIKTQLSERVTCRESCCPSEPKQYLAGIVIRAALLSHLQRLASNMAHQSKRTYSRRLSSMTVRTIPLAGRADTSSPPRKSAANGRQSLNRRMILMRTQEEHVLRILGEAPELLLPSEIRGRIEP